MPNTATRLITLILLLQDRPNQKGADLARQLGVSVRSLHRYLGMLDEMGIPIYSERGPYGGFSLVRGYKMPPLVLTPEEAVAVSLGASLVGETWGSLYREAAQAALAKLDHLLPDEQRAEIAWARRTLVATGMRRATLDSLAPTLETLRAAVRSQDRVEMLYRGASGTPAEAVTPKRGVVTPERGVVTPERGVVTPKRGAGPTKREVDPYALVYRWGWWYLVGYCHLRGAVRTFRVDRISELRRMDQRFASPVDFDIHAYLETEWKFAAPVRVKLRFAPQAAEVALANQAYWDALEVQPDGAVLVEMSAPDANWAASSTLAYGPLVTVLEPPELRQMVREWAAAVVENNRD